MDTIVFHKVYRADEDPRPYIALDNNPAPDGLKAWIRTLKGVDAHICWFKIQCHKLLGMDMPTQRDIDILRAEVENWLNQAGLCLSDFTLSRIDYDYNFFLRQCSHKSIDNKSEIDEG